MNGNQSSDAPPTAPNLDSPVVAAPQEKLHRLAAVRRAKGVSCYDMARHLGITVEEVRRQEEMPDVAISTLNRWAAALGVPVTELVVETDEWLNATQLAKSQAERLKRIAANLRDSTRRRSVQRLAQTFIDQLTEIHAAAPPFVKHQDRRGPKADSPPPRTNDTSREPPKP